MSRRLVMLDLCAGRGGASQAMVERGWEVHRVELTPGLLNLPLGSRSVVDHLADVCTFRWAGPPPDLLWASPPCTEFTRTDLPWLRDKAPPPGMHLLFAALGHVATLRPRWWAVENVRGAIRWFTPWLGPPLVSAHPVFLWGRLPPVEVPGGARKSVISGTRSDLRSRIPFEVSQAIAEAVELAEAGRAA